MRNAFGWAAGLLATTLVAVVVWLEWGLLDEPGWFGARGAVHVAAAAVAVGALACAFRLRGLSRRLLLGVVAFGVVLSAGVVALVAADAASPFGLVFPADVLGVATYGLVLLSVVVGAVLVSVVWGVFRPVTGDGAGRSSVRWQVVAVLVAVVALGVVAGVQAGPEAQRTGWCIPGDLQPC